MIKKRKIEDNLKDIATLIFQVANDDEELGDCLRDSYLTCLDNKRPDLYKYLYPNDPLKRIRMKKKLIDKDSCGPSNAPSR